jgi:prolyl oligopeptidase
MENGGIYAVPNIRGGGDMVKNGMMQEQKAERNVFEDFIAAGEYLQAKAILQKNIWLFQEDQTEVYW